ncbi:flagellar hook-basal body complex protein FliE [Oscillospiraceae bacterium MB08-C2-2]|nr:flagellar hook-basal body complex protein FliE [Oscillospiraceae bacterium MB08-C2-2]
MNIIPINTFTPAATGKVQNGVQGAVPFRELFESALTNVEETQAIKDQDTVDMALGLTDDLGAAMANMQKADIAVTMLVQMRNKVLDAYSEIMRINL